MIHHPQPSQRITLNQGVPYLPPTIPHPNPLIHPLLEVFDHPQDLCLNHVSVRTYLNMADAIATPRRSQRIHARSTEESKSSHESGQDRQAKMEEDQDDASTKGDC